MKKIKIMPEYGCSPLWLYDEKNSVKNLDISELAVSQSLKNDILLWANTYESTFDEAYPPDSGFSNNSDEKAFESAGVLIWEKMLKEPSLYYAVSYYSILTHKIYETLENYQKKIISHPYYALKPASLELVHI
jgi:hypothetical protein